ncbi:MAG: hypothetical protein Q8K98_05470 [Bacteroidota bacterium]|nr:hypothetical protein [Bacteroidota bacterium]
MYASVIGKKLVELINKEEKKERTPKEFFNEVYFPLFYDHPKYFHWTINSPFVQGYKSSRPPSKEQRAQKLEELHNKVRTLKPDASFSIGFGAADDTATTSGQITSLTLPIESHDIYYSWIGAGFGIGMAGGLVMLIDNPEILKIIYEGWCKYRQLLNETGILKGNQIETWNGQWLSYALNNNDYLTKLFNPVEVKKEGAAIPTQSWIKVLFAIAKKFPNGKLMAYVYNLGQTNTTIGFIQINLPEIKREIEMYNLLFGDFDVNLKKAIEDVYTTQYSFKYVCQNGAIGLKEIEPKGLKEYLPSKNKEAKEIKFKRDEKNLINYNIYLSWVIAMLNNKTIIQKAEEAANMLLSYASKSSRGKTTESNKVKILLDSVSRRAFIENLVPLIEGSKNDFFNALVEEIDKMQADKFPYFLTLLKFKYVYLTNKNLKGEKK